MPFSVSNLPDNHIMHTFNMSINPRAYVQDEHVQYTANDAVSTPYMTDGWPAVEAHARVRGAERGHAGRSSGLAAAFDCGRAPDRPLPRRYGGGHCGVYSSTGFAGDAAVSLPFHNISGGVDE